MSAIEIIFASIGGAATLVLALGFLAKSLIQNLLSKDIESYKITLNSEKDIKLTELRHEFELMSTEHRMRFETLHSRREEIIAELYSKLVEFHRGVHRFIDMVFLFNESALEDEKNKLWNAVDNFKDFSEKHRIYFSTSLCEKLDEIYKAADQPTSLLMSSVEEGNKNELHTAWNEAKEVLDGTVSDIRRDIEAEFREILGVKE